jgi:hypothetical protein
VGFWLLVGARMSLILLVFGILIAGAGMVAIAFGSTVSDSALGQSLIITGAIALVGGPMLMGVASVISQLSAIAESFRLRPATQISRLADARQSSEAQRRPATEPRLPDPRASDPRASDPSASDPRASDPRASDPRPPDPHQSEPRAPEPGPADPTTAAAAIDVSGSALERLRSTVRPDRVVTNGEDVPLSPNGSGHHHGAERKSEPRPEPEARPGAPAETGKEPRLDFLFRPKTPPRPPQQQEQFDSMWPKRRPGDQSKPDEVARQPSLGGEPRAEREPRSVAILKSGVVDGMAYTLYADGSIEAQLPHGTVRFGSIAELRAHIENNS